MLGEWQAFERHYGPLLVHDRVDYAGAVTAAYLGGGGDLSKFMPYWHRKDDPEQSADGIAALLREMAARPKES